jgi:hypothetical protein
MRFWDRVRLGFRIVFGLRFGVIVDQDYADGGDLSGFTVRGADIGIYVTGSPGRSEKEGFQGISVRNNRMYG